MSETVKAERLAELQAAIERHQAAFNQASLGRTCEVLLERPGRHPGQVVGRSPHLQAIHVTAPANRIGELCDVEVTEVGPNSLGGVVLAGPRHHFSSSRPNEDRPLPEPVSPRRAAGA